MCGGGGGGGALLKFYLFIGVLYVFLWTETGLAFLDRSRTEMGNIPNAYR